jgi:CBS domain-containing protein
MKGITVREMMVPLVEYATVTQDATLYEAVVALERAQMSFDETRDRHRAILVCDENRKIVGKLSQIDIIKALEPDYREKLSEARLSRFGISDRYMERTLKQHDFWKQPLDRLCAAAGRQRVTTVMSTPTKGEYIDVGASMQEAIQRLVVGNHLSLLATDGEEIVGVLRLTDVFSSVCQIMKRVAGGEGA